MERYVVVISGWICELLSNMSVKDLVSRKCHFLIVLTLDFSYYYFFFIFYFFLVGTLMFLWNVYFHESI